MTTRRTGSTSLDDCAFCQRGQFAAYGSCFPCPKGTYATTGPGVGERSTCVVAPSGTYTDKEGSTEPTPCPPGTTSPFEGETSPDACVPCPAGTYSPFGGAAHVGDCQPCLSGLTKGDKLGSTSLDDCTPAVLPSDMYLSNLAAEAKIDAATDRRFASACPAGSFVPGGLLCVPCPAGFFSSAPGSTSCEACPKGTSSLEGSSSCTKCPAGTYTSRTGTSMCEQCPLGEFMLGTGATACELCPEGEYAPFRGSHGCAPCPTHTYANAVGSRTCKPCPGPAPSAEVSVNVGAKSASECLRVLSGAGWGSNILDGFAMLIAGVDES